MKHKIRNENNGFTLVELVVTIAVLAVISVPLLKYFADSMRHNTKMEANQNAVVAAQNVLEDLKAADIKLDTIEDLMATTAPGATPGPTPSISWSPFVTAAPGSVEYEVKGNYTLDGKSYTVKAKINPRKSLTNQSNAVKTYSKADVPTMDSSNDLVSTENATYMINAMWHFEGIYGKYCDDAGVARDPLCTDAYFAKYLKREICIKLEPNSTDADKVDVSVTYKYLCDAGSDASLAPAQSDFNAEPYEELIEKATLSKEGSHNIFVFYTPLNYQTAPAATPDPAATPGVTAAPATPPVVVSDEVKLSGNLASTATAGTGTGKLSYQLYLIADSSVARTNAAGGTYKLTLDSEIAAGNNANDYVSDVFTNLGSSEFQVGTFAINASTFSAADGHGVHADTLVTESAVNRIAEIEVSVYQGDSVSPDSLYTTVNGTKIQKQ